MKKKHGTFPKSIMFLLIIMLALPLIQAAQPPAQLTTTTGLLTIIYPQVDTIKPDSDTASALEIHYHIFNSTGQVLNNSDVACKIHVYNSSQQQIIVQNLSQDDDGVDLLLTLNSTTYHTYDTYPYIVWCNGFNGQVESGYLSSAFSITPNGIDKTNFTSDFTLGILILIPILFAFILMKAVSSLGDEHGVFRIFLFLLSSLMIMLSLNFALIAIVNLYGFTELQELIGTTTYWLAWTLGGIVMYWLIFIIYKIIDGIGKRKQEQFNY